ncbi:hypothetical protein F53441_6633 [Fusarium austroafricanum]|uniref:Uncharacterized protein n=1 Tax=Fusarium austroafricanum TaxID=2364996 RepID=A0A8H4KI99_9HYPO|nr:hypothetical protein F53441_6633 [Fusarium austroafricanum]
MSGSSFNLGTEQPVQIEDIEMTLAPDQIEDIEMTLAPDQSEDSEMPDVPEDGIKQYVDVIRSYGLTPQELATFNAIRAAREQHQCSRGLTPAGAVVYECEFCKAVEDYLRTAGQNNVHWN